MREIKFRAWHKVDGWCGAFSIHQSGLIDCGSGWMTPAEANIHVMQYTGYKDRNGKEIYEGDIVYFRVENPNTWTGPRRGVIVYDTRTVSFGIQLPNMGILTINQGYDAYGGALDIEGNIYENPELLDD